MNILNLLNDNERKLIRIETFRQNKVIFYENEICSTVGVVLEGSIKIYTYSSNGKEIIFNTINKDSIFGNNLIFSSNPKYRGNVITESDSKIAFIDKKNLMNFMQNNRNFLVEYLKVQSEFGKNLNFKIKMISLPTTEERLLYFLSINNKSYTYKFISKLAEEIGVSRESLSRCISKLVKENKLKKEGNKIFIK